MGTMAPTAVAPPGEHPKVHVAPVCSEGDGPDEILSLAEALNMLGTIDVSEN